MCSFRLKTLGRVLWLLSERDGLVEPVLSRFAAAVTDNLFDDCVDSSGLGDYRHEIPGTLDPWTAIASAAGHFPGCAQLVAALAG